jgi:hypothetical protein
MQCLKAQRACLLEGRAAARPAAAPRVVVLNKSNNTNGSSWNNTNSISCRYRGSGDRGDHRDEGWTVWTSNDPINGGLSAESQSVLLCLLEKKVGTCRVALALQQPYMACLCYLVFMALVDAFLH